MRNGVGGVTVSIQGTRFMQRGSRMAAPPAKPRRDLAKAALFSLLFSCVHAGAGASSGYAYAFAESCTGIKTQLRPQISD